MADALANRAGAPRCLGDDVRRRLGIGAGGEDGALLLERGAQRLGVQQRAVVDEGDFHLVDG